MPRKKKEATSETFIRKVSKPRVKLKTESKPKAEKKSKASVKKEKAPAPKAPRSSKKSLVGESSPTNKKIGRSARLPRLGQTQLVAFVRDPNCIFTYWEVTPDTVEEVRRQLMDEYEGSSLVLRVLRTKRDGTSELVEEIVVNRGEMNRYVNLETPGGSYILEIGHKAVSGKFVALARTQTIHTGPQPEQAFAGAESKGSDWSMPEEMKEYFSDEIIEQSFEPGKKLFSADLAGQGALHRRRLGPQDRHAASRF